MNGKEVLRLANEIAKDTLPVRPSADVDRAADVLAVAKIIVQCQQREFQENGLAKIEEMMDKFLEDRAAPVPPLPLFQASDAPEPASDLTTGLVTQRQHPKETEHALLYADAYGVVWFCLFDEEQDGEKERQRVVDKGYTVLAIYHKEQDGDQTGGADDTH